MSSLASLPSELLSQILSTEATSFFTIALWKCGNLQLNHKLAQGVHFLHLSDQGPNSTSRYPKLVCELQSLRYLHLSRGPHPLTGSPIDLNRELRKLQGARLQTRNLISTDSGASFFNFHITERGTEIITTQYALGESRFFDLAAQFPCLRALWVETSEAYPRRSDLSPLDFAGLPPTLTSLKTPVISITHEHLRICATLPRSLLVWDAHIIRSSPPDEEDAPAQTLPSRLPRQHDIATAIANSIATSSQILPQIIISEAFWEESPPQLDTVTTVSDFIHRPPFAFDRSVPKTLSRCNFQMRRSRRLGEPYVQEWSLATLQSLPPSTLSLGEDSTLFTSVFGTIHDYQVLGLPVNITSIDIAQDGDPQLKDIIPTLPRTLLFMSIENAATIRGRIDTRGFKAALLKLPSFWPSRLRSLTLGRNFPSCDMLLQDGATLPSTLESLIMVWDAQVFSLDLLPLRLESLELRGSCVSITGGSRSGLRSLLVGLRMEYKLDDGLPPSLLEFTSVLGQNPSKNDMGILPFPSGLQELSLGAYSFDSFDLLPRGLRSLTVRTMTLGHSNLHKDSSAFQSLPTSLIHLDLASQYGSSTNWAGFRLRNTFAHLEHLQSLQISSLSTFDPEILIGLPTTLRSVAFKLHRFSDNFGLHINPLWRRTSIKLSATKDYRILLKYWPNSPIPASCDSDEEKRAFSELLQARKARSRLYPDPRTLESTRPTSLLDTVARFFGWS